MGKVFHWTDACAFSKKTNADKVQEGFLRNRESLSLNTFWFVTIHSTCERVIQDLEASAYAESKEACLKVQYATRPRPTI